MLPKCETQHENGCVHTLRHPARFDFAAPLWSRDSSMDIALPIWPAKLLAPVASSVLVLRLCLQVWGCCRAIATNAETPVAVPLIADAATQAAMEADTVSGLEEDKGA